MTADTVKHTPGPWSVSDYSKYHVVMPNGRLLCSTGVGVSGGHPDRKEDYANARLISAAPDLLEALKGLLADIEEYQSINKLGGENNHWQVISRAAIAKAEGRS